MSYYYLQLTQCLGKHVQKYHLKSKTTPNTTPSSSSFTPLPPQQLNPFQSQAQPSLSSIPSPPQPSLLTGYNTQYYTPNPFQSQTQPSLSSIPLPPQPSLLTGYNTQYYTPPPLQTQTQPSLSSIPMPQPSLLA